MTCMSSQLVTQKQAKREEIERQIAAFEQRGGKIQRIDPGVFTDPTRVAHKTMRNRIEEDVCEKAREHETADPPMTIEQIILHEIASGRRKVRAICLSQPRLMRADIDYVISRLKRRGVIECRIGDGWRIAK